jgi:hypothetical protein
MLNDSGGASCYGRRAFFDSSAVVADRPVLRIIPSFLAAHRFYQLYPVLRRRQEHQETAYIARACSASTKSEQSGGAVMDGPAGVMQIESIGAIQHTGKPQQ